VDGVNTQTFVGSGEEPSDDYSVSPRIYTDVHE